MAWIALVLGLLCIAMCVVALRYRGKWNKALIRWDEEREWRMQLQKKLPKRDKRGRFCKKK